MRSVFIPFRTYQLVWCSQEDNQCLGEEAVEEEEDNDKDYVQENDEEDKEEEEVVAAFQSPASAKAASSVQPASCVVAAGSVQATGSVQSASGHVVQNHNQQRDILGSNFIGRTSFLAIHYDPPLGPFSEYFFFCTFCCTRIHLY